MSQPPGASTSTTAGSISLVCTNGNSHPLQVLSGSMTAILVGALN